MSRQIHHNIGERRSRRIQNLSPSSQTTPTPQHPPPLSLAARSHPVRPTVRNTNLAPDQPRGNLNFTNNHPSPSHQSPLHLSPSPLSPYLPSPSHPSSSTPQIINSPSNDNNNTESSTPYTFSAPIPSQLSQASLSQYNTYDNPQYQNHSHQFTSPPPSVIHNNTTNLPSIQSLSFPQPPTYNPFGPPPSSQSSISSNSFIHHNYPPHTPAYSAPPLYNNQQEFVNTLNNLTSTLHTFQTQLHDVQQQLSQANKQNEFLQNEVIRLSNIHLHPPPQNPSFTPQQPPIHNNPIPTSVPNIKIESNHLPPPPSPQKPNITTSNPSSHNSSNNTRTTSDSTYFPSNPSNPSSSSSSSYPSNPSNPSNPSDHSSDPNSSLSSQPSYPHPNESTNPILLHLATTQNTLLEHLVSSAPKKKAPTSTFPTLDDKCTARTAFRAWYFKVISLLATPDWSPLYDPIRKDIIEDGSSEPELDKQLYSALLTKTKEKPLALIQSLHQDYWGHGVLLLKQLKKTYFGALSRIDIRNLQQKLVGNNDWYRAPQETVESFASRTLNLHRDLMDHNVSIDPHTLKESFILGLGPEFTDIQRKLNTDDLPSDWQSLDILELVAPARKALALTSSLRQHNADYKKFHKKDNDKDPPTKAPTPAPAPAPAPSLAPAPASNYPPQTPAERERKLAIHRAINAGTYKASDFTHLVPPGCCVFHGTPHPPSTDPSKDCQYIQKCINNAASKNTSQPSNKTNNTNPSPNPTPSINSPTKANKASIPTPSDDQLAEALDNITQLGEQINNDTNTELSSYFQITCKNTSIKPTSTPITTPITETIVDSGAFPHMFTSPTFFTKVLPWDPRIPIKDVTLADGSSKAPIKGIGTVRILLNKQHPIELKNVLYVPSLSTNLFSLKEFLRYKGCFVHGEDITLTLAFPTFITNAIIKDEIFLDAQPTNIKPSFSTHTALTHSQYKSQTTSSTTPNNITSPTSPTSPTSSSSPLNIKSISSPDTNTTPSTSPTTSPATSTDTTNNTTPNSKSSPSPDPTSSQDNTNNTDKEEEQLPTIPLPLKATKLPSWIHHDSKVTIKLPKASSYIKGTLLQHTDDTFILQCGRSRKEGPKTPITTKLLLVLYNTGGLLRGHTHLIRSLNTHDEITNPPSSPLDIPIIHKPLSTWPEECNVTPDYLQKSFGFRNINTIIKEIKQVAQPSFHITNIPEEKIIDLGKVSTIPSDSTPKKSSPLPNNFGETIHMDIIYGTTPSIDGTRYGLFLVDQATRHKFIYPLTSLQHDTAPTIHQFCKDIGRTPNKFYTDFDHKLMGQKVLDQFKDSDGNCIIESAPPRKQSKNGLAEANWKSILYMARSWLTSHLLPSSFWWFALKRATELSNYLPIKINNEITSPFTLTYNKQPDYRNIIPQFSIGYLQKYRDGDVERNSYDSQSIRAILIGRDDKSAAFKFYHPPTKKYLTSDSFTIDDTLPSGPAFGLEFTGGLYINRYSDFADKLRPPLYKPNDEVYITSSDPSPKATILTIPSSPHNRIYTVQLDDGSIHQYDEDVLSSANPSANPNNNNPPTTFFPRWIKNLSKATLHKPDMEKPLKGYLLFLNDQWYFKTSSTKNQQTFHLKDFTSNAHTLCKSGHLFQGHPHYKTIQKLQKAIHLTTSIAKHISARGLTTEDVPTLLQHRNLNSNDRKIWDDAYAEEYFGLTDLPCWTTLTEAEFKKNKHLYKNILPSMAVSTIKYDENGKPKRAKYRIVALGNHEPYKWSKSDCYAPVLSLLEIRLLTALAVKNKCVLKNADVKQAFVQATLPPEEQYIIKPPVGCPHTPPNSYWKLLRTLYGLRRSPRHWYDRFCKIMKNVGLTPCPNAPCIFTGTLIPGQPPIYVGSYVDDLCYFSASKEVEKEFETRLTNETETDFMGKISHYLGLKFQWRETEDKVSCHISQEAFADRLIHDAKLDSSSTSHILSPFKSGLPVDSIPQEHLQENTRQKLKKRLQSYIGSLLWLAQATRPDLSVITSLLAQHQNNPSPGHLKAALHVIKYVKETKHLGIAFHSDQPLDLQSFINFPISKTTLSAMSDANWGPQYQSIPKSQEEIQLFLTRSISGHLILLHGPLHWSAKRQKITARSTGEAEIYATDECVKDILRISHIIKDLNLESSLLSKSTIIYNDNQACVQWNKNTTSRAIRHIQIRENASREAIQQKLVDIKHIDGKLNLSDIFTKEQKDTQHFLKLRSNILSAPFPPSPPNTESSSNITSSNPCSSPQCPSDIGGVVKSTT